MVTRYTLSALGIAAVVMFALPSPALAANPGKAVTRRGDPAADGLVRAALESELAGRNDQREALLRQAAEKSPGNAAAHWHLGQVRVEDKWVPLAEAERAARNDPRLAKYRRLRDAGGANAAAHAALAQWCRKNQLPDEQRVHWLAVLELQPDRAEAIQALGIQPFQGMMLTPEQAGRIRTSVQNVWRAADRWRPVITRWRSTVEREDAAARHEVEAKIAGVSDPADLAGLERALWQQVGAKRQARLYRQLVLAMIRALSDNPHPAAAESLARQAIFSEATEVRQAAVEGLRRRPLDHYVPLLLAGLQTPIEASLNSAAGATGHPIVRYSMWREGALADLAVSLTISPAVLGSFQVGQVEGGAYLAEDLAAYQRNLDAAWQQAARDAAAMRTAVERFNRAVEVINGRIYAVLAQTTGQDLPEQPAKWWKWWWQDYNEQYVLDTKSGPESEGTSSKGVQRYDFSEQYAVYLPELRGFAPGGPDFDIRTARSAGVSVPMSMACSCFARGTKVWTLTGRVPIEQVRPGDRVLAQDPDSGELAYKPVLAVTLRAPGPRLKIGIDGETITATPSHPFWVLGQGWRMTKQLKAAERLHTLSGSVTLCTIEAVPAPTARDDAAINLIVADFNTYFVGERGVLVHDNTARRPTAARVPGLGP